MKLILYHGTTSRIASDIMEYGFSGKHSRSTWDVKGKEGFVYLSIAYAPFYAESYNTNELALIKCEVNSGDAYPEDDFIMYALHKPKYTQEELNKVSLEYYKPMWRQSLKYMGNIAAKPSAIKILGYKNFDGRNLIMKCDPVISPLNFQIMGDYYRDLSEWIYQGKPIMKFRNLFSDDDLRKLKGE